MTTHAARMHAATSRKINPLMLASSSGCDRMASHSELIPCDHNLKNLHDRRRLRIINIDLCNVSAEALDYFRKRCTEGLVKVLKDVVNSPYSPEYDVSGIADPFLHIRLLRLLRLLGHGDADASDCMNDIHAQESTFLATREALLEMLKLLSERNITLCVPNVSDFPVGAALGDILSSCVEAIAEQIVGDVASAVIEVINSIGTLADTGIAVGIGGERRGEDVDLHWFCCQQ
ncbi:hypothetical protein NE237_008296 [Protea cynaroides]|uniref:Uncharacterized protein n=1 Tax=Protea cynaroides TaxID=273540 RepID=A0A9Q0GLP5_9MAGN|nr:hypothetical protein NE237_008296 [Protea cynaroides]